MAEAARPLAEGRVAGHRLCPALVRVVLALDVLLALSCVCVVFFVCLYVRCVYTEVCLSTSEHRRSGGSVGNVFV